ncbi:MAG: RluA family pseudouridine synthase [Mariprofundaceae bacterium]|nr:RluA family pseudouridine synthase [Mariprofundaceae bacterium]
MASSEVVQSRIIVDKNEDGSRLDRVLVRRLGNERRSLIMRLIRKGNVRVNGKRQKPESRVVSGDEIFLPGSLRSEAKPQSPDAIPASLLHKVNSIDVLFEDQWLLAVNKPAGMVVHGGSGHGAGLIEALKEIRKLSDLRLAHRLDRDTSGVLLMAKNLEALRKLTESFRERDMRKTYFAWVKGHPYPYAGRMISNLSKGITVGGERMVIDDEEGKESITDYQVVLEAGRDGFKYALVALNPHSGRTHQLRVQLLSEGHAILGDPKYAEKEDIKQFKKIGGRGLALHAWRLRFEHPVKHEPIELRVSLPESWKELVSE